MHFSSNEDFKDVFRKRWSVNDSGCISKRNGKGNISIKYVDIYVFVILSRRVKRTKLPIEIWVWIDKPYMHDFEFITLTLNQLKLLKHILHLSSAVWLIVKSRTCVCYMYESRKKGVPYFIISVCVLHRLLMERLKS